MNVGLGHAESVLSLANKIKSFYKSTSEIIITGEYRKGDIRHNRANIERLLKVLECAPKISLEEGVNRFLEWAQSEPISEMAYAKSIQELKNSRMFIKAK
jgi:dTDP-L-rhamnose 4-epimerase